MSKKLVLSGMRATCVNFQVSNSVVGSVPVSVMDDLSSHELSSQILLHHKAVLKHILSTNENECIPPADMPSILKNEISISVFLKSFVVHIAVAESRMLTVTIWDAALSHDRSMLYVRRHCKIGGVPSQFTA
jgi:hypothetical protein